MFGSSINDYNIYFLLRLCAEIQTADLRLKHQMDSGWTHEFALSVGFVQTENQKNNL